MSVGACACGNAAATECGACGAGACSLCTRGAAGARRCIACFSSAARTSERSAREAEVQKAARPLRRMQRMKKRYVAVPAALTALLMFLAAAVIPLLDAARAREERRAEQALRAIVVAQARFRAAQPDKASYGTLDDLHRVGRGAVDVPGYDVRVDLSHDRRGFWARAIPLRPELRPLVADQRGEIAFEAKAAPQPPPAKGG